mgnify:CR=1 FL=1
MKIASPGVASDEATVFFGGLRPPSYTAAMASSGPVREIGGASARPSMVM